MKAATTNPFGSFSQLSDGQYHRPAHAHYDGSNTTFLQTSDVNTHSAFFLYENCKKPYVAKLRKPCAVEAQPEPSLGFLGKYLPLLCRRWEKRTNKGRTANVTVRVAGLTPPLPSPVCVCAWLCCKAFCDPKADINQQAKRRARLFPSLAGRPRCHIHAPSVGVVGCD